MYFKKPWEPKTSHIPSMMSKKADFNLFSFSSKAWELNKTTIYVISFRLEEYFNSALFFLGFILKRKMLACEISLPQTVKSFKNIITNTIFFSSILITYHPSHILFKTEKSRGLLEINWNCALDTYLRINIKKHISFLPFGNS